MMGDGAGEELLVGGWVYMFHTARQGRKWPCGCDGGLGSWGPGGSTLPRCDWWLVQGVINSD